MKQTGEFGARGRRSKGFWRAAGKRWLLTALVLTLGGVWLYHEDHTISASAAERIAMRYAVKHRWVGRSISGISMQEHERRHGVWLEPYFFIEMSANGPAAPPSLGRVPDFLEITVSGATGAVVATEMSRHLQARYPIRGENP
jgi:hypothetical protein